MNGRVVPGARHERVGYCRAPRVVAMGSRPEFL